MVTLENPRAGQGPVVLDIGGDIGALIVIMPSWMENLEVEIIPAGTDARDVFEHGHVAEHEHEHTHRHGEGGHVHAVGAPPHVAVVPRPAPDGSIAHSLVYGELLTGSYDLYVRPDGPIRMTARVVGGQVTELAWPDSESPGSASAPVSKFAEPILVTDEFAEETTLAGCSQQGAIG